MDGATIQAKIYRGYAQAAARVGTSYAQYRPTAALTAAVAGATPISTILAAFDAKPDFRFQVPNGYAKPIWFALADGTNLLVGDYLVGAGGTFFVAGRQALLPIQAVSCNATVSVIRPGGNTGVGVQPYGGDYAAVGIPIATGYPASILQGTKGERGDTGLPGDVRMPWFSVLLPPCPGGVLIQAADDMTDTLGRRYKVSSAELTDLGWRLTAMLAET